MASVAGKASGPWGKATLQIQLGKNGHSKGVTVLAASGDAVLQGIAEVFRAELRDYDVPAKLTELRSLAHEVRLGPSTRSIVAENVSGV